MLSHEMRRVLLLVVGVLLLLTAVATGQAQTSDERCFEESPYCISGRMRAFWEQHGGMDVFGLPITAATAEIDPQTGRTRFVQWFERHRLELLPYNPPPYDVLLGRLGVERLEQRGIEWQLLPRSGAPLPGCLWVPETASNICDQAPGEGFRTFWETHGLNDPARDSYQQSLALFGLPLSDPYLERTSSGQQVLTQWFERARFEWYPANPASYRVMPGLLGREVLGREPGQFDVAGLWQGQTSQGQRLLFDVQEDALQMVLSNVTIDGERDDGTPCSETLLYTRSAPPEAPLAQVRDNVFTLLAEDEQTTFSIAGQFESAMAASGTLLLATHPGSTHRCIGNATLTWHAVPLRLVPTPTPPPPPTTDAPPPTAEAAPADTAPPSDEPPDETPRPTRTAPPATAAPDITATPSSTPVAPRQVPSDDDDPAPTNTPAPEPTNTPAPSPQPAGDLCSRQPAAADAPDTPLRLVEVTKKSEIVTLENVSSNDIDLSDWTLCSLTGGERHVGFDDVTIEAGDTRQLLHIGDRIWDTERGDDGALYDPDGNLISYWDDPS
jgi:hypothetical protein